MDPRFGRYFAGKLVSSLGTWIQNIVAAIVMWDLTGSAAMVGAVSVMQFAGPLLLTPLTGLLTDVLDRRLLLMWGRMLSATGSGSLAAVAALDTLTAVHLLVVAGVVGVGFAISAPSQHALIPALVPAHDLSQAVTMNSSVGSLSRAVGPGLGSLLLLTFGAGPSFAVVAVSHAFFAFVLIGLTQRPTGKVGTVRALDGLRYVWRDWRMGLLLIGVAGVGFGADPMTTLTPALADDLGAGEGAVGIMASAFGVGAMSAALLMPTVRRWINLRIQGMLGFGALGVGMVTIALSPVYSVALIGFVTAGAGFLAANASLTTRIQRRVPDELRGRIMALWTLAFLGSRPLAAGVNGLVADATSVRAAILLAAAVASLATLLARVSYPVTHDGESQEQAKSSATAGWDKAVD